MRKIQFARGEYYHIYNRGTDKRAIFLDKYDLERFFQSMEEFNTVEPIGSIYENSFKKDSLGNPVSKLEKLVNFVCYCLNKNHYHFILTPLIDKGIEKFMHRLGIGYTKFFNEKYERDGVLFQGGYKAIHIDSNEYLLYLSAYVNLNNKVHKLGNPVSKSSWEEYIGKKSENFCGKEIILSQFKNKKEYKEFAEESLKIIRENKEMEKLLFD